MQHVLSELIGDPTPMPWIMLCQRVGGTRWMATSSYADKKEARRNCKLNNKVMRGSMTYKIVARDEWEQS